MTMPTLIVEIGFSAATTGTVLFLDDTARGILDTNTLAAADLFVDVTQWVTGITTRRGATRSDGPTLRYEAGTATITFRNDDRRFDPANLAGPYVAGGQTQVEPLRAVRVRATWNGQTWPLWRGFTDQWSVAYDGPNSSTASVTCFDAFGVFSAYNRLAIAAVGAGETTSARVGRVLDSISWPAGDRMIGTGEETVQATTLADNVLTELQLTADTELGDFFMDAEGRVVFRARSAGYSDSRSAYPQSLFGDQVDLGIASTVNLVTNPSSETDITGWSPGGGVGGPTLSQSSAQAMFGTKSLLVTWGGGGFLPNASYDVAGLTVGNTYTMSVYVYVPTGSARVVPIVATTNQFGDISTVNDQWQRLTWTGTATAATMMFQVWPVNSTAGAGETVYLDGLQVEEGDQATDYVDGTQALCEWDGVAHASTSRRLPELPYSDAPLAYDALSITNTYNVARAGGTTQTTSNAGSVSAYLTRSHQRTDLLMQTDAEALLWAEQLLARTALPELRFAALELTPTRDPDRLWEQAFGREIGDRIRVIKRPPGGGAPIEQEAWVRGIEHNLPVSGEWQTTLVLEQARDVTRVVDTFTRTGSSGWGTADSGQTWTTSGGSASDYSTTGSKGRLSLGSVNVYRAAALGVSLTNVDILAAGCTISAAPTGGQAEHRFQARLSGTSYVDVQLFRRTTGDCAVVVRQVVSGSASAVSSTVAVPSSTSTSSIDIRFQAVGSTVRARAWVTGGAEPSTWLVTSTGITYQTAGDVQAAAKLATGNTNTLPVTVDVDSITVTQLHTWA